MANEVIFAGKHPHPASTAPDPHATANVPLDAYTGPQVFRGVERRAGETSQLATTSELGGTSLGNFRMGSPPGFISTGATVVNTDPTIIGKVDKLKGVDY